LSLTTEKETVKKKTPKGKERDEIVSSTPKLRLKYIYQSER